MIFLFDADAGKAELHIKGENFKYLIKVRRHSVGDILGFRNKTQIDILHRYEIVSIEPRAVILHLLDSKELQVKPKKVLHIGWCVIDSKSVEKVLASLNEIGVSKISFIYCDRSQKNFKADFKRYERILEASNQQCGRTAMMEFSTYKRVEDFLDDYPDVKVFDFCDKRLECESDFSDVLIGCEGGFSDAERELLASKEVFRLDTPMVLRSESAALAVASKILL
jgi:16S rRNA (uracil1498-N3)-methyltransferase